MAAKKATAVKEPTVNKASAPAPMEPPSDTALKQISQLAHDQLAAEATVAKLTEELELAQKMLLAISDEALPNAMTEAHLKSFTLDNGHQITIADEVAVNISEHLQPKLFAWLEKHGFGGLIKNVVSVPFGKDEEKAVTELGKVLTKMKMDYVTKKSIHAGTAKAFVKEQLAAKKDVPLELFGAYPYQRAKIK